VALKVLHQELSHDDAYRRRLIHEARATGEVRHRHPIPVLDPAEKAVFQVAVAHLEEEVSDPCADRDDCPRSRSWAVLRALAKDPSGRPPTATAYARMGGLASGTVPPSP
jgi:hypothetical protein